MPIRHDPAFIEQLLTQIRATENESITSVFVDGREHPVMPPEPSDRGPRPDPEVGTGAPAEPVQSVPVPEPGVGSGDRQRTRYTFDLDASAFERLGAQASRAGLSIEEVGRSLEAMRRALPQRLDVTSDNDQNVRYVQGLPDFHLELPNEPEWETPMPAPRDTTTFREAVDTILNVIPTREVVRARVPFRTIPGPFIVDDAEPGEIQLDASATNEVRATTRDDIAISGGVAWMYNADQGEWQMVRGLAADATLIDQQAYAKSELPLSDRRSRVSMLNDRDLIAGAEWARYEFPRRWTRYIQRLEARNLRPRDRSFLGRCERTRMPYLPSIITELLLRGYHSQAANMHASAFTWPMVTDIGGNAIEARTWTMLQTTAATQTAINDILQRTARNRMSIAPYRWESTPPHFACIGRGRFQAHMTITVDHIAALVERPGKWYRLLPSWAVEREFHNNGPVPVPPSRTPESL